MYDIDMPRTISLRDAILEYYEFENEDYFPLFGPQRLWTSAQGDRAVKASHYHTWKLFDLLLDTWHKFGPILTLPTCVSAASQKRGATSPPYEADPPSRLGLFEDTSIAILFTFGMGVTLFLKNKSQAQPRTHFPEISMLVWNAGCLKLAFDAEVWEFVHWG